MRHVIVCVWALLAGASGAAAQISASDLPSSVSPTQAGAPGETVSWGRLSAVVHDPEPYTVKLESSGLLIGGRGELDPDATVGWHRHGQVADEVLRLTRRAIFEARPDPDSPIRVDGQGYTSPDLEFVTALFCRMVQRGWFHGTRRLYACLLLEPTVGLGGLFSRRELRFPGRPGLARAAAFLYRREVVLVGYELGKQFFVSDMLVTAGEPADVLYVALEQPESDSRVRLERRRRRVTEPARGRGRQRKPSRLVVVPHETRWAFPDQLSAPTERVALDHDERVRRERASRADGATAVSDPSVEPASSPQQPPRRGAIDLLEAGGQRAHD